MIIQGKTWEHRWVQSVMKAICMDICGEYNITKCMQVIAETKEVSKVLDNAVICGYHSAKHNEGFYGSIEEFGDAVTKAEDVAQCTVDFCNEVMEYYGIKSQGADSEKK